MKKISLLALAALCLTSCWTSIWTVAPTTDYEAPVATVYSTQVNSPSYPTTTTTVTVTSFNNDWCFYLDLQAVAAAFAEASSVQEFERLLNSSRYMINNLDLNRDGWVDYLRVIETYQGYRHALLIQACLAPSIFQDVATLVAEWSYDRLYVEVIGDRYLYGYNYVVRPVFVRRPPMWDVYGRSNYSPWSSPYHHGYWPNYYQRPQPVYLNHYQAYVNTYLLNHHYCHHCEYPQQPYWNGYSNMTSSYHRHDYQDQHPNDSFENRVTHHLVSTGSGQTVRNAGQLREETQRVSTNQAERVSTNNNTTNTTNSNTNRTSTNTSSSSTRSSQPTTTQSSSQTTRSSQTTTRQPSTSVSTRVSKNGETKTTIKQTNEQGKTTTVQRTGSTSTRSSESNRSSGNTRSSENNRTSENTSGGRVSGNQRR